MNTLTFTEMRGYLNFHGATGVHAAWCARLTCDGQCEATTTFTAVDGRTVTATIRLPHDAYWPVTTVTAADGLPFELDGSQYTALNQQVRAWNQAANIPDPIVRPARKKATR